MSTSTQTSASLESLTTDIAGLKGQLADIDSKVEGASKSALAATKQLDELAADNGPFKLLGAQIDGITGDNGPFKLLGAQIDGIKIGVDGVNNALGVQNGLLRTIEGAVASFDTHLTAATDDASAAKKAALDVKDAVDKMVGPDGPFKLLGSQVTGIADDLKALTAPDGLLPTLVTNVSTFNDNAVRGFRLIDAKVTAAADAVDKIGADANKISQAAGELGTMVAVNGPFYKMTKASTDTKDAVEGVHQDVKAIIAADGPIDQIRKDQLEQVAANANDRKERRGIGLGIGLLAAAALLVAWCKPASESDMEAAAAKIAASSEKATTEAKDLLTEAKDLLTEAKAAADKAEAASKTAEGAANTANTTATDLGPALEDTKRAANGVAAGQKAVKQAAQAVREDAKQILASAKDIKATADRITAIKPEDLERAMKGAMEKARQEQKPTPVKVLGQQGQAGPVATK